MAESWEAFKDPDDRKDYSLSWSDLLVPDGDTIDTAAWEVVSGDGSLTIYAEDQSDLTTTIWVSGGTSGVKYDVRCRIVTTSTPPRQHDRTRTIKVKTL